MPDLTQEELNSLGADVVRTFELDKTARAEWDKLSDSAMKLAKQVKEQKSFPWSGAANVKHPLITVSCIQFAARAYPEIVKGAAQRYLDNMKSGNRPTESTGLLQFFE